MAVDSLNKKFELRHRPTSEEMDQKLKDVGKLYEKQFLREMTRAMRQTVQEGSLIPASQGEKIFREQMDDQYVEAWGDKGGIGLGGFIYQQLRERLGPQLGLQPLNHQRNQASQKMINFENPQGPVPVAMQNDFQIKSTPTSKSDSVAYEISRKALSRDNSAPVDVLSPWSGQVLGVQELNPSQYVLDIQHDSGLKSRMSFKGAVEPNLKLKVLSGGEKVGTLASEAQSVFLRLDHDPEVVSE